MTIALPQATSPGGASLSYTDPSGALRIMTFDCTVRVLHNGTAVATEFPVDQGANVTDHIRPENRRLTLEVEVTNTPLFVPAGKNGAVAALPLSIGAKNVLASPARVSGGPNSFRFGPVAVNTGAPPTVEPATYAPLQEVLSATTLQFSEPFDRVLEVAEALDELRVSGTLVTPTTKLRTYQPCAILSVAMPEEAADAITFTIELSEIRLAESQEVEVQPPTRELRAQKKTTAGSQTGHELSDVTSSAVVAGLDALPDSVKKYLKGF